MKDYKKVYCEHFDYDIASFVPSEVSNSPAQDIHHIINRKRGSTIIKPRIEILMALTRDEHTTWGDKVQYKAFLLTNHYKFLEAFGKPFDKEYLQKLINRYAFICPVCQMFNCLNLLHLEKYSKLLTSNIR